MPALDKFHAVVRTAMEKEGWKITADPWILKQDNQKVYIDLGAERLLTAVRGAEKIAVEIKSFGGLSFLDDLHQAVGQYVNYCAVLRRQYPTCKIYLAVPYDTYTEYFHDGIAPLTVEDNAIALLVYNPITEEIAEWIS